ncbi:hypothetical protein JHK86_022275 [Glycine max]|nr:hypothetical protein JHK86_022275 [Glycine max]
MTTISYLTKQHLLLFFELVLSYPHCMMVHDREIHSLIFHTGFDLDELTSSALVDMYAKCGDIKSAVQVFEELATKKDVISWNSMIVGFAKNGYAKCALKVFDEMTQSCITPDDVTHSLDCLPLVSMQGGFMRVVKFFTSW